METLRRQMVHYRERLTRTLSLISEKNIAPEEGRQLLEKIQQSLDGIFNEITKIGNDDEIKTISAQVNEDHIRVANALFQLSSSTARTSSSDLNPPNLDIPTFDGDAAQWPMFIKAFQYIHYDSGLSDGQRMRYLKLSLRGRALNLVQHLPLTGLGYQQAWTILRQRYGNKRIVINTLAQKIIALPDVKRGESLLGLLNHFKKAYQALRHYMPGGDLGKILILNLITNHLDSETFQAWEHSLQSTEVPSVEELIRFLEMRAGTQDSVMSGSSTGPSQHHSISSSHTRDRSTSQASQITAVSNTSTNSSSADVTCLSTVKTGPFSSIAAENLVPVREVKQKVKEEVEIVYVTQHRSITQSVKSESSDADSVSRSSRRASPSSSSCRKRFKADIDVLSIDDAECTNID